MKQRILTGWNFVRVLYLLMGITLIIQSIMAHQYGMALLGVYVAGLSVLGLGCMGGHCNVQPKQAIPPATNTQDVTFQEVK